MCLSVCYPIFLFAYSIIYLPTFCILLANGVVKVDQRIIDIVQDSKAPDEYQKPRSKSIVENGSLSRSKGSMTKLEKDERDKEAKELLKMVRFHINSIE